MQSKRNPLKLFLLILSIFAMADIACWSAAGSVATDAPSAQPIDAPLDPTETAQAADQSLSISIEPACAVVTADEALHLRADADPNSRILAWMRNGEEVKLINAIDPNWWLVQRGSQTGYARAKYLKRADCR